MEVLTSYAFWIRLFGIFEFLSYGVHLIGRVATSVLLAAHASAGWQFSDSQSLLRAIVPELVGVILAAAIIWKADWIADRLEKLRANRQCPNVDADNP